MDSLDSITAVVTPIVVGTIGPVVEALESVSWIGGATHFVKYAPLVSVDMVSMSNCTFARSDQIHSSCARMTKLPSWPLLWPWM